MISLLIPTMNRSEFVIRLLKYYDSLKFKYHILIGDSSRPEEFEKTNQAIRALRGRLKVEHYHYPGLNNYAVTARLIQNVSTPYSTYLCDDDFYPPRSIERCIAFMDKHPDYSCAWGKTIAFSLRNSRGAHGQFHDLRNYCQCTNYSVEKDNAKDRLIYHIDNYASVFIGVCRTSMFKKALRNALEMNRLAEREDIRWWTSEAFSELLTSFSLVIQGKVKTIDCLYWIRQIHDQRYVFPDVFDWITSPNWLPCYELLRQQVIEDIREKDDISLEEAKTFFKQVFWKYLSEGIYLKYQVRYVKPENIRSKIKKKIKNMPALYYPLRNLSHIWRLTAYKLTKSEDVNLVNILDKSSLYYEDFMPVYNCVTALSEKEADTEIFV